MQSRQQNIKNLTITLLTLLMSIGAWAEDEFPVCEGDLMTWVECSYAYETGDNYSGLWKEGRANGQGSYTWSNGNFYKGEFLNNQPSGKGEIEWFNGDTYKGQWLNGRQHGYGTFFKMETGIIWSGEWKNGMKVIVTEAVKKMLESSKKEKVKDTYICDYEFNSEIFRFILQRDDKFFLNVQQYQSKDNILWEDGNVLIIGNPIQDMLKKNQLIYRTITLDKESGKFNVVATAEPEMDEYDDSIWALVNGQCEKLN
jgi:hypothetical protein